MTPPTFDETLSAARAGEAWACARLYEHLKGPAVTYVRLRGTRDPDDVTSEVFLCVFRDLHRFRGDEVAFRAWVFTIAHRRMVDAWRRRARRPGEAPLVTGLEFAGGDSEHEAVAALALGELEGLLGVLTAAQREVVVLHVLADLPLAEVAAVTGRSVSAVKALYHRAAGALRRAVGTRTATTPAMTTISVVR